MTKYAVIDLETTGHSPKSHDKIIEIGLVIIEDHQIVDQYSTLINPNMTIPTFITSLTGISDEDVASAPLFGDVVDHIKGLLADCFLVAHNADFDVGFLNDAFLLEGLPKLTNPVIDTVELARILYPTAPAFKLGQLADYLKIQHEDPHRALSDAIVTGKVLIKSIAKMNQLPYETIVHLERLSHQLKSNIQHLLSARRDALEFDFVDRDDIDIFKGLAIKKTDDIITHDEEDISSYGDLLDDIYEEEGVLSQKLERYEKRPGQRFMSEAIFDAFQSQKHALIEAETGTGKSLAYLIPAIYEAYRTSSRVVISTYTTQLQSQLLEEEVPLVKSLLPFPFKIALLKGKRHYISLEKFSQELNTTEYDHYGITLTKAMLLIWLTETKTGDIEEVTLPSSGYAFYNKVSAEGEGYHRSDSIWFSKSYYQKARQRAQKANVIVTNHALLCTDLLNDSNFIPAYDKAIVDEAHHLEDTVSRHYGLKLDYQGIQYVLNQIGSAKDGDWLDRVINEIDVQLRPFAEEKWHDTYHETKKEIDDFFNQLFQYVKLKQNRADVISDIGRIQYRFKHQQEDGQKWAVIVDMCARLTFYLRDLIHMLTLLKEPVSNCAKADLIWEEAEDHIGKLQDVIDQIESLFLLEDDQNVVKWLEIDRSGSKNTVSIFSEPLEVSDILHESFFMKKNSIILTSATLTMNQSFSYMMNRLGVPSDAKTAHIKSPFNYEDQVKLMVPKDFPDIKHGNVDEFIYATCEAIVSLAEVTNGRMLVLFTSYDMLRRSYDLLKETLDSGQFVLFAQGITSGSRSRLKKNFQTFDQAILLGTSSFWEGVDIPGEDLSSLVIVRLPFQPPGQPAFEARGHILKEQGKNAFMELALPQAVIRFKQGFGRLIRSTQDRGIVFVCDARIVKSRYGRFFTKSIPDVPVIHDSTSNLIQYAKKWF
ncbi:ATP-dependent DNA helicase DinG [Lentibacillus saliphilus]|uniref:ATP-dependent DNA helicase DinG n=1 Tax=Lentibacillus saliphilus TaxID=2737028 RepID=UPI001C303196|nr:ATP-dependent DNA helicase DinG [Lentibacillus saliphilus]